MKNRLCKTKRASNEARAFIIWRRGRESNPSRRLCRPLHNRFATSPEDIVRLLTRAVMSRINKGRKSLPEFWSGRRVSNSRPQPWQGCALPTELLPLRSVTTDLAKTWSGRRVSNSRPQPWQGCALPTELLPHGALQCTTNCMPQFENWSGRRVSNSRPQPWQGCALPTELLPRTEQRL